MSELVYLALTVVAAVGCGCFLKLKMYGADNVQAAFFSISIPCIAIYRHIEVNRKFFQANRGLSIIAKIHLILIMIVTAVKLFPTSIGLMAQIQLKYAAEAAMDEALIAYERELGEIYTCMA